MNDVIGLRYRWKTFAHAPRDHWFARDGVPALVMQLLWNRNIRKLDEIDDFLGRHAPVLHSPSLMRGMRDAIARLTQAKEKGERVAVYGDYDVDGLTSTALLVQCLQSLGYDTEPFLPRRHVEGYGLNVHAIDYLHQERGVGLIVAVDCGISARTEIEHARKLGIDVIVVDHHHVPEQIPRAVAVVNPHHPECVYPFKELCGVGITYKLSQALLEANGHPPEEADQWLDLVALGTIADVVPLVDENRILASRGLVRLNENPISRVGLRALVERAGFSPGKLSATSIAFGLAPRINAIGRLADPNAGLSLLLTESEDEARELAEILDLKNRERQRLTDEALENAREQIGPSIEGSKLLLAADSTYPIGIVGLVAGRLVEQYFRPSLVATIDGDEARGSARSIEGFHIAEALAQCDDILERHGGHARAAGFTVRTENLPRLHERLAHIANRDIADQDLEPSIVVDAEVNLRKFGPDLHQMISVLEPHGSGNPRPLFMTRRLRLLDARPFGRSNQSHLRLTLTDSLSRWEAVGFGMADLMDRLRDLVDIAYTVEQDDWNGRTSIRLRLVDLCPSTANKDRDDR